MVSEFTHYDVQQLYHCSDLFSVEQCIINKHENITLTIIAKSLFYINRLIPINQKVNILIR
jgi:hypothetical protein